MSNEDKASPDLRYLIRATLGNDTNHGNPDALNNVNSVPLPDGAQCYVIAEQAVFVLQKANTGAYIAGERIIPVAGPGRWVKSTSVASTGESVALASTGFNSFPVTSNWAQTTSSAVALDGDATGWALTAAGSILTYTGPTRDFVVTLAAAARVGDVGEGRNVFLGISYNGDGIGVAPVAGNGEIDAQLVVAAADYPISTVRKVKMSTGNTLRPMMAGPAGAVTLQAALRLVAAAA